MSAIVISLELVNSAIENLTDLVTREQNPLAGKVKDISASSVLVAAISSVIIGIIIFGRHVLEIVRF
jgi:diacylglycerol kinase